MKKISTILNKNKFKYQLLLLLIVSGFCLVAVLIGSPSSKLKKDLPIALVANSEQTFHALSCLNQGNKKQPVKFYRLNEYEQADHFEFEVEPQETTFSDLKNFKDQPYTYLIFTQLAPTFKCSVHTFLITANQQASYFYSTDVIKANISSKRSVNSEPVGNILTIVTAMPASFDLSFDGNSEQRYTTAKSNTLAVEELPILGNQYQVKSTDDQIKHYAFHRWLVPKDSVTWTKLEAIIKEFNAGIQGKPLEFSELDRGSNLVAGNSQADNQKVSPQINKETTSLRGGTVAGDSEIRFVNNPTTRDGKHIFYVQDEPGDKGPNPNVNYLSKRYEVRIPFQATDTKKASNKGKLTCRFLTSEDNSTIANYLGPQLKKLENIAVPDSWEVVWSPTNIGETGPIGIRIANPEGKYLDYIFSFVMRSGFPSNDTQKSPVITVPNSLFMGPKETTATIGKIFDSNLQDYNTLSLTAKVISEPKSETNNKLGKANHHPTADVQLVAGEDGFSRYFYLRFYNSYDTHPLRSGVYQVLLTAQDFMGFKSEKIVTVNIDSKWEDTKEKPILNLPNSLIRYIGVYSLYRLPVKPQRVRVKGWGETFAPFDGIPGRPAIPSSRLETEAGIPLILLARGLKKYPKRSDNVKIRVETKAGQSEGIVKIEAKQLSTNLPPAFQSFFYEGPNYINPGSKVQWTITLFDPNQLSEVTTGGQSRQPQAPIFFNNNYGAVLTKNVDKENSYLINWTAPKSKGRYIFSLRTGDLQGGITNYRFSAEVTDEVENPRPPSDIPSCKPFYNYPGVSNKIKLDLDNGPKEIKQFYLRASDPQNKYPFKVRMYLIERAQTCSRAEELPLPSGFSFAYNNARNDAQINWSPAADQGGNPSKVYRICTELKNKADKVGYCQHTIEVKKKSGDTTTGNTTTGSSTQTGTSSTGTTGLATTTGSSATGGSSGSSGSTTSTTTGSGSSGSESSGSAGTVGTATGNTATGTVTGNTATGGSTGVGTSTGSSGSSTSTGQTTGTTVSTSGTSAVNSGTVSSTTTTTGTSGTNSTGSSGSTGTNSGASSSGNNSGTNSGTSGATGNTASVGGTTGGVSGTTTAASPSPTPKPSASPTPTVKPSPLPTPSPSASPRPSASPKPSFTPVASPSLSPTPTATATLNPKPRASLNLFN